MQKKPIPKEYSGPSVQMQEKPIPREYSGPSVQMQEKPIPSVQMQEKPIPSQLVSQVSILNITSDIIISPGKKWFFPSSGKIEYTPSSTKTLGTVFKYGKKIISPTNNFNKYDINYNFEFTTQTQLGSLSTFEMHLISKNEIIKFILNGSQMTKGLNQFKGEIKQIEGPSTFYIKLVTGSKSSFPITINKGSRIDIFQVGERGQTITKKPFLDTLTTDIYKKTIGSKSSSFGESCGCTIWIILLILVLVAAGYMYYINRGNIKLPKLPNLPGRIAQFGRDIKSIRKN